MIRITCSGCARKYRIKNGYAGRVTKCPKCDAEIRVPMLDPTEPMPMLPPDMANDLSLEPVESSFISRDDVPPQPR